MGEPQKNMQNTQTTNKSYTNQPPANNNNNSQTSE